MTAPRITSRQLVQDAKKQIRSISVDEAQKLLGQDNVQFVDVRDIRELRREGSIPGAYHAPRGMLEFWIDQQSEYAKPVFAQNKQFVFYCAVGFRSALAAKLALDMGLAQVCDIEGGFSAWRAQGADVQDPSTKPAKRKSEREGIEK